VSSLVFPTLPGLTVLSRERIDNASVYETASGKEQRVGRWAAPRYRYRLGFGSAFLRSGASFLELQALEGFAARVRGRLDTFLWADPEDQTVTSHVFGVGNGSATVFQFQRSLVPDASLPAASSRAYWPNVGDGYEPVYDLAGAPSIYVDGSLKAAPADYALGVNGLVTFTAAPAVGKVLTWTGSYWKRCRFDSDSVSSERVVAQLWKSGGVVYVLPAGGDLDGAVLYGS
jgi:hypothetical protein